MKFYESITVFIGRAMLSWFFLSQAFQRLRDWQAMVILTDMKGIPAAPAALALSVGAMIFGGSALMLGLQTRFSAMVLAICTLGWTFVAHDFWMLRDPIERDADHLIFSLGIALTGGLLVLVSFGGGLFALDNVGKKSGVR